MTDRSSFPFSLWRATKLVLIPLAVLGLLLFAVTSTQRGLSAARLQIEQLAFPEIALWLLIACVMFLQRRVNRRFTALQDEIEELKERISHLETHADH